MEQLGSVANLLTILGTIITSVVGYVGDFMQMIISSPILIFFVLLTATSGVFGLVFSILKRFRVVKGGRRRR